MSSSSLPTMTGGISEMGEASASRAKAKSTDHAVNMGRLCTMTMALKGKEGGGGNKERGVKRMSTARSQGKIEGVQDPEDQWAYSAGRRSLFMLHPPDGPYSYFHLANVISTLNPNKKNRPSGDPIGFK